MHIKRINKNVLKKVVAGLLIALSTMSLIIYQNTQVKNLKQQLQLKQTIDEMNSNYTETRLDATSIKEKFNEIKDYKCFKSTINIKHKYIYTEESILGMHKKATLVGTATIWYEYTTALENAEITETQNTITILIPRATLNKETVHIVPNTFYFMKDESSHNVLSQFEVGRKVQHHWNDTCVKRAYEEIKDYYKDDMDRIDAYTVKAVKDLAKTFTSKNVNVKVK